MHRFKARSDVLKAVPVAKQGFQTKMPRFDCGGITVDDLKAIYKFLVTLKPVNNRVINIAPGAIAVNKL